MKTLSAVAAVLFAVAQDPQAGTTYYVGHSPKFVNISFESEADVETIVGTTNQATGEISVDFAKKTGSVSLTVPVASMKTGIDMRDQHLRDKNWLDAATFPDITFKSKKIEFIKDKPNEADVAGEFSLHGSAREIKVRVHWKELAEEASKKANFPEGKWIRFTTTFEVKLSDYGVKVPEMAAAKVSDDWTVKMTLFAGTSKPKK